MVGMSSLSGRLSAGLTMFRKSPSTLRTSIVLREWSRCVTFGTIVLLHADGRLAMSCHAHGTPHVRSSEVEHEAAHDSFARKNGTAPSFSIAELLAR